MSPERKNSTRIRAGSLKDIDLPPAGRLPGAFYCRGGTQFEQYYVKRRDMKKLLGVLLLIGSLQACNNTTEDKEDATEITTEKKGKDMDEVVDASQLPVAVTTKFNAKYPGATGVIWEHATENNKPTYKAKWVEKGEKMKAEFGEDGTFIKGKVE